MRGVGGGVVALCVSAALGLDFLWYKGSSVQLVSAVLFGFIADGAVGFWIMDRRPWLGVVLAVFGCVIFTLFLLWTVVAMALGPLFAVTAIQRAKVLSELDRSAPPDAASSAG